MTKDEAKNVLMDTFTKAQCSECYVADALVPNNCNEYCAVYKQFKEAIAVIEKCDDSKGFSDSAEPSGDLTCKTCADRAMCIMSAPDGNWKACKDYRPSGDKGGDAEVTVIPEGTGLMQPSPNNGADLISREDAIEAVKREGSTSWLEERGHENIISRISALPSAEAVQGIGRYENAMQKLREMPMYLNGVKEKQITKISADRPSIVRCGECKRWQDNNNGYPVADCKWNREETPDEDDFCSWGERKGGDTE